jgi:hypothetical protein
MNSRQGEQMHQPAREAIGKVVYWILTGGAGEGQVVSNKSHPCMLSAASSLPSWSCREISFVFNSSLDFAVVGLH